MREPAATPPVSGKTERPPRGAFFLSSTDAAHAARLALERLRPSEAFFDVLERYVALLLEANARVNLTRVIEPDAIARLHLLDALAALPLIDARGPTRAADLGSGGGVPGLVLAIARPGIAWTLVDSVGKKAAILRDFADQLSLENVSVLAERAETLGRDAAHRERYDLVTARACAPLPVLAELGLPLLKRGGQLLAWKGPLAAGDPEVRAGNGVSPLLGGGEPRLLDAGYAALGRHHFVTIDKLTPTPPRFPRRPGEPARRPLG
jgi:16S rRNA (guanine527-N7)-methyltransferase